MQKNNINKLLLLLLAPFALAGCISTSGKAPDELSVIEGPPLWLPPDYELRPPREASSDNLRRGPQSLQTDIPTETSASEEWFLEQAGAEKRDPNIRTELVDDQVAEEEAKEKESFLNRLNPFSGKDSDKEE